MGAKYKSDGTSVQEVGTPPEFLRSVERLLGQPIKWDLACNYDNCVVHESNGYTVEDTDSLTKLWPTGEGIGSGLSWLNPPFKRITPWAAKCSESKGPIAMLVPASVGANWFWDYVMGHAHVFPIYPRLQFVGHEDPFPKDLMLCVYRPGIQLPAFARFNWLTGVLS